MSFCSKDILDAGKGIGNSHNLAEIFILGARGYNLFVRKSEQPQMSTQWSSLYSHLSSPGIDGPTFFGASFSQFQRKIQSRYNIFKQLIWNNQFLRFSGKAIFCKKNYSRRILTLTLTLTF